MTTPPPEVEIALIQKEVADLRQDVRDLSREVAGLIKMWETASGVVSFVKWLASLAAALGVLWAAFRVKIGG